MGAETPNGELEKLKRQGKQKGLHVERHRVFDPLSRGGDLYVQQRRAIYEFQGGIGNPPSLIRYATAEKVQQLLAEHENKI